MTKEKFLNNLSESILELPTTEIEKTLNYYCEIIDDYIESGLNEEEAIKKIGNIQEIANKILEENMYEFKSTNKFINLISKIYNSNWRFLILTILTLGFPIWLTILTPILIILLIIFIFFMLIPAFTLSLSIEFLWNPSSYHSILHALYSIGVSLIAFGASTLYITILTKLIKATSKHIKILSIKIRKLKLCKKGVRNQ